MRIWRFYLVRNLRFDRVRISRQAPHTVVRGGFARDPGHVPRFEWMRD